MCDAYDLGVSLGITRTSLEMSEQDCLDSWSSVGDSVSSDSYSSDSETSSFSNNDDHQSSSHTRGARYLKRAGIFTREEVIEQAIDRWSTYIRLCGKAMTFLRETMVENYVREVVEAKAQSNFSGSMETPSAGKITPPGDLSTDSKYPTLASSHRSAELRALRRFGRHSSRVENAKRAAAVSKFAIMSTQLAPWQRSGGGQQSCKYRDPTTTTWEHRCSRPCVPLLPYCAAHLVLSEDTPPPPHPSSVAASSTATTIPPRDVEVGGDREGPSTLMSVSTPPPSAPGKPQKPPSRKSTSAKVRSTADGVASFSDIQFPPQFLFRKCCGGPNNDCTEPVIAWTATTRCPQHANLSSVFPMTVVKEEEMEEGETAAFSSHSQNDLQGPPSHPLLGGYADSDILIVSACRTPIGRFCGSLASIPTHELGGCVISECIKRASKQLVDHTEEEVLARVGEVIMGQVYTAGGGQNPARQAAKAAGLSYTVPAWGLNMLCASGMKAVCQCAQTLKVEGGLAVAGGQESMSRCPHITAPGCSLRRGGGGGNADALPVFGDFRLVDSLLTDGLEDAFHGVHMGVTAENIAQKFQIGRKDQDAFALESQARCKQAMEMGKFRSEIVPINILKSDKRGAPCEPLVVSCDEPPRPQTTMEALAKLPPAFANGLPQSQEATVTAGNASTLADGAAALLLCRADTAKSLGLRCPLGRIVAWHQSGCDPQVMGLGPIDSVKGLMEKLSWSVDDVDLFELNEAFAAQSLAVLNELGLPKERTNVNGGAIALGHPIGCSGARILVTLVHSLHRLAHSCAANVNGNTANSKRVGRDGKLRGIAALCVNVEERKGSSIMTTPPAFNPEALLQQASMANLQRVFVQRDFTEGTAVRFQTSLPERLTGKIPPEEFSKAISDLNAMFDKAEALTPGVVCENLTGCLTAYLLFLCMPTHYERMLDKIAYRVIQLNDQIFMPHGLLMIDPAERGLRMIEICILNSTDSNPTQQL
ncbi:Acetyl-CoA acetyltransferase cytosolic [Taenia crassiceps]|uniref:Acetyl-CoA acetyltransferase cytosolic n=1 Tax=Taenia crassiceps TaxID=6207 RepID=A0ABR4QJ58_9CEST